MSIEIRNHSDGRSVMEDALVKQKFEEIYQNLEVSSMKLKEAKIKLKQSKESLK